MSPRRRLRAGAFVVILAGCSLAGAASLVSAAELRMCVRRPVPGDNRHRPSQYLQKTPDLALFDGRSMVPLGGVGFIAEVERAERDKRLVWVRSQGLRGWAPASDLVPVTEAEAYFSRQVEDHPRDAFSFLMRGVARFANDDIEHAFADINEAIRLQPTLASAWIERAYLWHCRDRLDRALTDVNEAIRLEPNNSHAYIARAGIGLATKDYAHALSDLEKAHSFGSRSPLLHTFLGMIHVERKQWENAIAEFKRSIEIDPRHLDGYVLLASVYTLQSEHKRALALFNQIVDTEPRDVGAREARAIYFIQRGKYPEALKDLNAAIELDPTGPSQLYTRAALHNERGDFKRALADLNEAIRLDPNYAEVLYVQATILAMCPEPAFRDARQAVVSATRACDLTYWKEPRKLAVVAAAYSEVGDLAAAVKWQQKAIDLAPADHPEQFEFRRLLARYKAGKPYHQLGLLEEIGLRRYQPAAAKSERAPG
jgi:tetratricopeptide (TPR) repeat protein